MDESRLKLQPKYISPQSIILVKCDQKLGKCYARLWDFFKFWPNSNLSQRLKNASNLLKWPWDVVIIVKFWKQKKLGKKIKDLGCRLHWISKFGKKTHTKTTEDELVIRLPWNKKQMLDKNVLYTFIYKNSYFDPSRGFLPKSQHIWAKNSQKCMLLKADSSLNG